MDIDHAQLVRSTVDRIIWRIKSGGLACRVPLPEGTVAPVPGRQEDYRMVMDGEPYRAGRPQFEYHPTPELFYQISGEVVFSFPKESFHLRAGDLLLVPPRMPHKEHVVGDPAKFSHLVFAFDEGMLGIGFNTSTSYCTPHVTHDERYLVADDEPLLRKLVCEPDNRELPEEYRKDVSSAALFLFFVRVRQILDTGHLVNAENVKIAKVRQIVTARLDDPELCVKSIARQLKTTPNYLSFLFRKETGMNIVDYVNGKRIEQAIRLLQDPSLSVAEVAAMSGFRAPSYFIRKFREKHGMSPGKFRQDIR